MSSGERGVLLLEIEVEGEEAEAVEIFLWSSSARVFFGGAGKVGACCCWDGTGGEKARGSDVEAGVEEERGSILSRGVLIIIDHEGLIQDTHAQTRKQKMAFVSNGYLSFSLSLSFSH